MPNAMHNPDLPYLDINPGDPGWDAVLEIGTRLGLWGERKAAQRIVAVREEVMRDGPAALRRRLGHGG